MTRLFPDEFDEPISLFINTREIEFRVRGVLVGEEDIELTILTDELEAHPMVQLFRVEVENHNRQADFTQFALVYRGRRYERCLLLAVYWDEIAGVYARIRVLIRCLDLSRDRRLREAEQRGWEQMRVLDERRHHQTTAVWNKPKEKFNWKAEGF